jgi:hypothetical protein
LGLKLLAVVSVFSLLDDGSSMFDVEVVMIFIDGNIDRTNGQVGLRCLCIVNGIMFDVRPDTSSPQLQQRATSLLLIYSNPDARIQVEEYMPGDLFSPLQAFKAFRFTSPQSTKEYLSELG